MNSPVSVDNNERLIRLEMTVEHQSEKLDGMSAKVDEMHGVFLKARGAQWLFLTFWIGVGALVVNLKTFLALLGVKIGS